jgi:hypothetical protein
VEEVEAEVEVEAQVGHLEREVEEMIVGYPSYQLLEE